MLFNSYAFGVFFPLVTIGYFFLPQKFRLGWLLIASCVFYAWAWPAYLLVLFALVLIDYRAGLAIAAHQGRARKFFLAISLAANLGILFFFKYLDLALALLHFARRGPGWPLPVGLSFHTFQAISYTVEVYRGNCPPQTSLSRYALYVLFYPQLVAGPIERPQQLLPQFRHFPDFEYQRVVAGLILMAWGLFKKVAVADRLGSVVAAGFDYPTLLNGPWTVFLCFLFGIQIYCDFCGYSDIARGAAQVMGIQLTTNFRQPFFSCSLNEFWRRWHISLANWFRDYLYVPLGGSRHRIALVMLVFGVSGLWHGAHARFVVWGLLLGAGLLLQEALLPRKKWLGWLYTLSVVTLSWIFFRASSWADVTVILNSLSQGWPYTTRPPSLQVGSWDIAGSVLSVGLLALVETAQNQGFGRTWLARQAVLVRWTLYFGLLVALMALSSQDQENFIYFQF